MPQPDNASQKKDDESAALDSPEPTPEQLAKEKAEREKAEEKIRERGFTLKIATITGTTGVLGALIGGFFTFASAQLQSERAIDSQQLSLRKSEFANYIADSLEREGVEGGLAGAFQAFRRDKDTRDLDQGLSRYAEVQSKAAHSSYTVSLMALPETNRIINEISRNANLIQDDIASMQTVVARRGTITNEQVQSLSRNVGEDQRLVEEFTKAAHNDILPPHRGIFDILS